MRYNCLIVDDEEALSQSTCEYFNMFNVKTAWTANAKACIEFLKDNTADLILLDINLGNASGFELCRQLRKDLNIPIIFISARTSDDDMLLALNIGGDDYVRKPYSLAVLLAKVKVVLKRYKNDSENEDIYVTEYLKVNSERGVSVKGIKVDLKTMEYRLLVYLIKNKGRVVPKEEIFRNVWKDSITGDNTLNVHVRRLREKIEKDPNNPLYIKTVWGIGYIFEGE